MKKFDTIKTVQLILLVLFAASSLYVIFSDAELYGQIAADAHIRFLAIILWLLLLVSFVFLFYDFNSFSDLKRENMELDHAVYSDALTGIANRYSVDVFISQYLNRKMPKDMGCITLDLINLKEINEEYGHGGGDEAIRLFSDILRKASEGICFIGRNGGNKFVAIFREGTQKRLDDYLETIRIRTEEHNQSDSSIPLRYVTGSAFHEEENIESLTELIALSDRRAYDQIGKS
mgnify:CR=1 FL=1